MTEEKLPGAQRRNLLLNWLKTAENPMKGSELARRTNVSRQVIVQDISLLKALNEPIIATSQGYIYHSKETPPIQQHEKLVACRHSPQQTVDELYLIVDFGVLVKDVIIEHPVYGDLTASIMVSNRREVDEFMEKIRASKASYLSQLTDGLHLHTLAADTPEKLQQVKKALQAAGYLAQED
ncbi:HTH domain-containing protein [Bacillus lacus]|uniref:HTH domain-containing protein n=1 Tax=Metabacillus lacus TaxID=1983721 RepID=A0A7X2LY48_9BACI|nr:transcription repressor NadR [Metabacillus lacus]MRX71408.1 HTH domain-containing protein [Metabacillus lacus]